MGIWLWVMSSPLPPLPWLMPLCKIAGICLPRFFFFLPVFGRNQAPTGQTQSAPAPRSDTDSAGSPFTRISPSSCSGSRRASCLRNCASKRSPHRFEEIARKREALQSAGRGELSWAARGKGRVKLQCCAAQLEGA